MANRRGFVWIPFTLPNCHVFLFSKPTIIELYVFDCLFGDVTVQNIDYDGNKMSLNLRTGKVKSAM